MIRPARYQAALGGLENSGLGRRRAQRSQLSEDLGPELRLTFNLDRACPRDHSFTVGVGQVVNVSPAVTDRGGCHGLQAVIGHARDFQTGT